MHDERTSDVQACIKCHKVRGDVRYAHTAQQRELENARQRLLKISDQIPKPLSARVRNVMFPKMHLRVRNLLCANCHQDHQGADFNLEAVSDDQCQACHAAQFDSFDGSHPAFDDYPFKRRTRLIYDHAGHFGRHFPETREKYPQSNIPKSCSNCHTSQKDRRQMMLLSFDETCSGCHLDQILGRDRGSGQQGIAYLTLPGIDVITLKEKNAAIGEWPEFSEAEVTPFMKLLLSRDRESLELLKKINELDLLDLTQATDQDIKAVTRFIWEIKRRIYAAVSGAATDVLADLPLDLIVAAQREWLPNLGSEMANRADASGANTASSASETRLSGSFAPGELPPFRPFDKGGAAGNDISSLRHLAQTNDSVDRDRIIRRFEPASAEVVAPPTEATATPAAISIENTVDAAAWAQYGGWYREDFAILYRPTGHKDQFIRTWLDLTGPYASESGSIPAAQIFDLLTAKDVPGKCVKCHSVDAVQGKGRKVNWSPALPEDKRGRFTTFIHQPHFGVMENKGCLTCHELRQGVPYAESFEQGDPQSFVSGFSQVDKELCQTCHTKGVARQDCMLCHKYHINGIVTPIIETKLPQQ